MDNSVFKYFDISLLALVRVEGLVLINPVFPRRGVPSMVRTEPVLTLNFLIAPEARSGVGQVMAFSTSDMVESLTREIILGLAIGCVFRIPFYVLYVAGDFLNTVFGLAVGKVMDPTGGVQISILGQFVNVLFYLYFFVMGCHPIMVRLFARSYQVASVGAGTILGGRILWCIITLFGSVFLTVIKLVLPSAAVEFILEMTMGMFMKLTLQIHVLVINVQYKTLLGAMPMMFSTYPMGAFMDRYTEAMITEAQKLFMMFGWRIPSMAPVNVK